jgi:hypothetical protein
MEKRRKRERRGEERRKEKREAAQKAGRQADPSWLFEVFVCPVQRKQKSSNLDPDDTTSSHTKVLLYPPS